MAHTAGAGHAVSEYVADMPGAEADADDAQLGARHFSGCAQRLVTS